MAKNFQVKLGENGFRYLENEASSFATKTRRYSIKLLYQNHLTNADKKRIKCPTARGYVMIKECAQKYLLRIKNVVDFCFRFEGSLGSNISWGKFFGALAAKVVKV